MSLREKRRETRACARKKGCGGKRGLVWRPFQKEQKHTKAGRTEIAPSEKTFPPLPFQPSLDPTVDRPGENLDDIAGGGSCFFFVVVVVGGGWKGDEKEESFFPLLSPSAAAAVGLLAMEDPSKVEEEKREEEKEGHQTTFSLLSVRGDAAAASSA